MDKIPRKYYLYISCFCRKENAANCIHILFRTWPTQERTLGMRRDAILNHPSYARTWSRSQKSGFDGYIMGSTQLSQPLSCPDWCCCSLALAPLVRSNYMKFWPHVNLAILKNPYLATLLLAIFRKIWNILKQARSQGGGMCTHPPPPRSRKGPPDGIVKEIQRGGGRIDNFNAFPAVWRPQILNFFQGSMFLDLL